MEFSLEIFGQGEYDIKSKINKMGRHCGICQVSHSGDAVKTKPDKGYPLFSLIFHISEKEPCGRHGSTKPKGKSWKRK